MHATNQGMWIARLLGSVEEVRIHVFAREPEEIVTTSFRYGKSQMTTPQIILTCSSRLTLDWG